MIRFPSISALRAFESASRHGNYTRAAEELNVTQSAISHQIKHIEELWGFSLFERKGRGLELTGKASHLAPVINRFIFELTKTVTQLQNSAQDEGYLRVSIGQSFALKWMVPRLGEFIHQYPDMDVTIITMPSSSAPNFDDTDIAIINADENFPGLNVISLLHEYSFPVCSPEFFKNEMIQIKKPEDLLKLPLLRRLNVDNAPRWRDWFTAAGVSTFSLPKGLHFPDSSMALQAAIDGQGVALTRSSHVADDISTGRLVKLFNIYVQGDSSYKLVIPENKFNLPSAQSFIAWIKDKAVESRKYSANPHPKRFNRLAVF